MTLRQNARLVFPWTKARIHLLKRTIRGVPAVGKINLGDLRRLTPISDVFGLDRGLPIDRVYIEGFLEDHAADIKGAVMEVADSTYVERFGGTELTSIDVLDIDRANTKATIIADLADAPQVGSGRFDAIVITQTLQLIYDVPAAIRTLHTLLKPGGVILLTVPGISSLCRKAGTADSWCWSFTHISLHRLMVSQFGAEQVDIRSYGNVCTATAFLHGLAADELETFEFDAFDPDYPVIVAARAFKAMSKE